MKHIATIKSSLLALAALMAASCSDEVQLGQVSTDNITTPAGNVVYVTDAAGKRHFSTVEFRNTGVQTLTLHTPKAMTADCAVSFVYDPTVLADYNNANGLDYEALPAELVKFDNGGLATIAAGSTTATINYTITSNGVLDHNKSYVLPVRATVNSGSAQLGTVDTSRLIFVRDLTSLPDATKYVRDTVTNTLVPAVKIFSCMEVNDTNPLNNLSFTLTDAKEAVNNGKPLIDALIIFSANINYNPETGRVYVFNNENVQALLDSRMKYLKPLQDRGMKIILGILGNHDRSGVANLADHTAKDFARECKALCDAYNLDGIFFDDEYSSYQTPVPPGFVAPSNAAAARLVYEIKKIQPERLTVAYVYGRTYNLPDVKDLETGETIPAGQFVDYALHDYGGSWDLASNYNGMKRSQMGLYSQEFAQGRTAALSNLQRLRNDGYGAHMIFAMDPNRSNYTTQFNAMNNCAQAFYDATCVFDGKKYPKDWK